MELLISVVSPFPKIVKNINSLESTVIIVFYFVWLHVCGWTRARARVQCRAMWFVIGSDTLS